MSGSLDDDNRKRKNFERGNKLFFIDKLNTEYRLVLDAL
jgi:hypothetical protein